MAIYREVMSSPNLRVLRWLTVLGVLLYLGVLQIAQDENTDADGDFSDRRMLGVARVSKNVGQESSVGMIFTNGKPTDVGDAYTGGVDFRYQDSNAFGS